MTSLTLGATGGCSPDVAWERYADLDRWSSWAPQIQDVTASADRLAPGLSGTVHAGLVRWPTVPVAFEVLSVDEGRMEWIWRAHVGPLSMRLEHGVEPAGAGSATWLRVHGPLPVVLPYAPLARLALGRLVRA